MKKLIFAILLFLSVFVDSYSQQSIRIGAGNIYYIGNDSDYFRANKELVMQYGFKSLTGFTSYGNSLISNANLTIANGILGVSGTGYISIGGVNINTLFGSLTGRNTWTDKNVFSDSAVFSKLYWSGTAYGDTNEVNAIKFPGFGSIFVNSETAIDLHSTYLQLSGKDKIDFKTNSTKRAEIDDDSSMFHVDHIAGLYHKLGIQAGKIVSDTVNATVFNLGGSPLDLTMYARIDADIIPDMDNSYTIGNSTNNYNGVYTREVFEDNISLQEKYQAKLDTSILLKAAQNELYVSPGNTQNSGQLFSTIDMAVDSADAGQVINVATGLYNENIVVTKPLTFNFNNVHINGGSGTAFYINNCPDSVKIKGFVDFVGGDYGVRVVQSTYNNTKIDLAFNRAFSSTGVGLSVVYNSVSNSSVSVSYNKVNGFTSSYICDMGNKNSNNIVNLNSRDSIYSVTNLPATNSSSALKNGIYNVNENVNIGNGTILNINSAIVNYRGKDVINLNDTGHAVYATNYSTVNFTANSIISHTTLYSTVYVTDNSRFVLNLVDSLYNRLGNVISSDSTSYFEINGGKVIDSTNSYVNTICYGNGRFMNTTFKNLATTDARVFDLGNSVLPKIEIINCYAEGNSSHGLVTVATNPNIVIRNTVFYNANLSGYCLRNYASANIPVTAYGSFTNVTHYNLAAGTFSFSFPMDSVRVASVEKIYVSKAGLALQLDSMPVYNKMLNTFNYNFSIGGYLNADSIYNPFGSLVLNDTVSVTKRLNVTQDFFADRDIFVGQNRYFIARSNTSGTQGAGFYSPSDGLAVFRNAGTSADATVRVGTIIATNVTPPATASSTGVQGTIIAGSDGYVYICIATNTWVRTLGLTW